MLVFEVVDACCWLLDVRCLLLLLVDVQQIKQKEKLKTTQTMSKKQITANKLTTTRKTKDY